MTMPDRAALRARVEAMSNIQTVPQVVARITALIDGGMASANEIAAEVAKDQVLAAKVLKLVNSGFYGFRQPITTVSQAMVLLGQDVIKTVVLTASVLEIMDSMNRVFSGLWAHSLATARAAAGLCDRLGIEKPEEVALAALLHDLGKVIIAQRFPAEHEAIRKMVRERNCLQVEAEQAVLGVGHPEVGQWLLKKWALPDALVHPIAYHGAFQPQRDFADRTAVVHVADVIARALGVGNPGDNRVPAIDRQAWQLLRIDLRDVEDVCLRLQADVDDGLFA